MKIWANTIVNNEENFIWFSLMSVVDYVDKILVWDTGSNDKTVKVIEEVKKIKGEKISFKQVGPVDKFEFTKTRQNMLEKSVCDWILILDGDEIWWEETIAKLVGKIKKDGDKIDGIVVPMIVPVGDIYHFQEEEAGRYNILGKKGHYNLRAINTKIPGLHVDWPYGMESYLDEENHLIQERENIVFLDAPYFHVTHLKRSGSKDMHKYKLEIGQEFKKKFKFPQVLYKPHPRIVSSPWVALSGLDLLKSRLITPLRKIKRKFLA